VVVCCLFGYEFIDDCFGCWLYYYGFFELFVVGVCDDG